MTKRAPAPSTMGIDDLGKLLDTAEQTAREIFARHGELQHVTVFAATRMPDGTALDDWQVLILPWCECGWDGTDSGRERVRLMQQLVAQRCGALAVINVSETWAAKEDPGQAYVRASERPDRWEAIYLRGECAAGALVRMIKILRGPKGEARLAPKTHQEHLDRAEALLDGERSYFANYFPPATRGDA